uniref:DUF1640 domain-containing protein n=2 Tax=unclassified Candidatus Kentrum TaxID=2643149 RepID=A0A451APA8_9GAMM|nr:MAG: hypothetical protein BECKLPF1236B_GA0070989_12415 [Candidatus Kentron sp. LPFa]VFK25606.1 MAG: hypothetical protein BECKLPF1236A_GA0070988_104822 [Candidatus Kentron sp. LPFa]VFK35602.1 MAG: hypothetical protein BECKLPF1236C_GA0070990_103973 [Candidatus Kentron sp. LPFa]VFK67870.1 MAG: hypothetical protein BECKUNK1418G_GA0071005_11717 [Candidatus Kentron sp. UNK]VFK69953.1 MAG: hypothetical protein BECKUNK1418H_GA0071006_102135 [Candidatus Kentron sp. UNK]
MIAVPFDTYKFIDTLREAGVEEKQAIAHKNALAGAAFATKADIDMLRLEMREMEQRIKIEIIKWMVGLSVAQTALVVGLIQLLSKS